MRYGVEESGNIKSIYVSGGATTETMISGLNSSTNYFIEVAAVNSAGTGVYSTAVFTITKGIMLMFIEHFLCLYHRELVDSISRDDPGTPYMLYIINAGISRTTYTFKHSKHHNH